MLPFNIFRDILCKIHYEMKLNKKNSSGDNVQNAIWMLHNKHEPVTVIQLN